jgi:hypothetical protein
MYSLKRQAVAVFLAGLMAGLPVLGSSPKGLVGVAQGTGSIRVNGQTFEGQASLFNGDRIVTGSKSLLTVISSPAERIRFQPETSAQVAREGRSTVVRLRLGAIDFRTAGAMRTVLPSGVTVSPAESTTTLAQVNRLANGTEEVAVYKGTVEVANAKEHVTVNAGHTAVIGPAANSQNGQNQKKKKKKKKLAAIIIAAGVNAGVVAAILANEKSSNISAVDP